MDPNQKEIKKHPLFKIKITGLIIRKLFAAKIRNLGV